MVGNRKKKEFKLYKKKINVKLNLFIIFFLGLLKNIACGFKRNLSFSDCLMSLSIFFIYLLIYKGRKP